MNRVSNQIFKSIVIVILFVTSSSVTIAQIRFSFFTGYGTYSMQEVKQQQQEMRAEFPVPAKTTVSFPGYYYYELSAVYRFRSQLICGVVFGYGSTGGRVSYSDYSGKLAINHNMQYMSVGFPIGVNIPLSENKWNVLLQLKPTINFGKLEIAEESEINSKTDGSSFNFKSTNIGLQPTAQLDRKLGPILIHVQGGYYFDVSKDKLTYRDDDNYYLQNKDGNKVHADWSGLRFGIGVGYTL